MRPRRSDSVPNSRWEGPAPESARPAVDLVAARERLLARGPRELDSAALRNAWQDLHESWLTTKAVEIGITTNSGFAIVATGSLGRGELLPHSDLDLMLVHNNMPANVVEQVADLLWYPLWDANIRLDHCVRTVAEALEIAGADISSGLAMLEARHIAGDAALSEQLVDGVRRQWRSGIRSRFGELVEAAHSRWRRTGEIAHRAEPDLKFGRGGLRDIQLLDGLAIAQLADRQALLTPETLAGSMDWACRALIDVRTELHRVSGRGHDVLLAQYADDISDALQLGDRFDLARVLSDAARTISYHVDAALRTAANSLPRRGMSALRRRRRRPLDDGVVEYAGEVVLARDARPENDPGLLLRVAAASAVAELPIAAATLSRLADTAPELSTPWPADAVDDLLVLLSAGPAAVATIESLDRVGLWTRLLPEWAAIRDLPPRDAIHTWTVDRHLVETAVRASAFATRVARPDLLILAALLHDIGKGRGTDHSVIGAELATVIGARLGMWPADAEMLSKLVRHHLLLAKTATRRDLHDPQTIAAVADAVGGDPVVLDVLHALTEADALATGPGVWSEWKASLISDLVRRCHMVMAGENLPHPDPIDPEYLALADDHGVHVEVRQGDGSRYHVVMIAPDERGLLSKAAGVLALNSLRVHSAAVNIHQGAAINEFVVSPLFGQPAAAELLRQQLVGALAGDINVPAMLDRRREGEAHNSPVGDVPTGVPAHRPTAPPRILWFGGTPERLIVEIRTTDRTGLLAQLTNALERAAVDIVWAKVTTVGSMVDDVFSVVLPAQAAEASEDVQSAVERELFAVLGDAVVDRSVDYAS
ncbi:[protein-PII] uridylyltransferase [Mycobacterium noviomagense]|uniref:Bifunctional uridylyltransferase/uridylyl-removing enzyme n=1 Tax=Mycobacterium noviomagense TaxID=459858 RepID=A0ABX3T5A0_9MYCO|nr:[protein-PII] uridylyltransferase [Mycobacterium noviomagense]ORB13862.1 [protein-PII] uridylyltransferase [Mycobacterium noviomagense]